MKYIKTDTVGLIQNQARHLSCLLTLIILHIFSNPFFFCKKYFDFENFSFVKTPKKVCGIFHF